jgi:hypothetical protein
VKSFALLLLAVLAGGIEVASAAATLSWTLPTTRENGEALAMADISAVRVYRAGSVVATLGGSVTSYDVSSCTPGIYAVTAVANGLESAQSNSAEVAIDQVGCRPKPPAGVAVH